MSAAAKIADVHETASLARASAGVEAGADLAFRGRKAGEVGEGGGVVRDVCGAWYVAGGFGLGWFGAGGMDGLMKGQMMVEWEIDRQTAQVMLRQPKNTLLWSSLSSAPQ